MALTTGNVTLVWSTGETRDLRILYLQVNSRILLTEIFFCLSVLFSSFTPSSLPFFFPSLLVPFVVVFLPVIASPRKLKERGRERGELDLLGIQSVCEGRSQTLRLMSKVRDFCYLFRNI